MAILKTLPGVEVTIRVKGKALQEYGDKMLDDDFDTVSRYIEAQSGQTFEIKIVTKPGRTRAAGFGRERGCLCMRSAWRPLHIACLVLEIGGEGASVVT